MITGPYGMLVAEPTGETFEFRQSLGINLKGTAEWQYLQVTAMYDIVILRTNTYAPVEAMRLKEETLELEVFEKLPNGMTGRSLGRHDYASAVRNLAIRPRDIDMSHNCHGYCFAAGEYWIDSDQIETILRTDGYEETDAESAESIIVYYDGDRPMHTAMRTNSRSGYIYVNKAGVRGLEMCESIEAAARDVPYNSVRIFNAVRAAAGASALREKQPLIQGFTTSVWNRSATAGGTYTVRTFR